jgi:phosphatidylserine/phosphatidylglycerophosphate/cardiolipin synthase-like enzyme
LASSKSDLVDRFDNIAAITKLLKKTLPTTALQRLSILLYNLNGICPKEGELEILGISPTVRKRIIDTLKNLEKESRLQLAFSLWYASLQESTTKVEICWTGPSPEGNLRLTEQVMEQLIINAKKEIIIVGYSTTIYAGRVLTRLEERSEDGVDITLILDETKDKNKFMDWVSTLKGPISVFSFPHKSKEDYTKLHAKCVLVDGLSGILGSANLTSGGMRGNIEIGAYLADEVLIGELIKTLKGLKKFLDPVPI